MVPGVSAFGDGGQPDEAFPPPSRGWGSGGALYAVSAGANSFH